MRPQRTEEMRVEQAPWRPPVGMSASSARRGMPNSSSASQSEEGQGSYMASVAGVAGEAELQRIGAANERDLSAKKSAFGRRRMRPRQQPERVRLNLVERCRGPLSEGGPRAAAGSSWV